MYSVLFYYLIEGREVNEVSKAAINVQYIFKEFSLTVVITLSSFNPLQGLVTES